MIWLDELHAAVEAFRLAKVAYTARLGALATKKNAGQTITSTDWSDLIVAYYDPMTAASNAMRSKVPASLVSLNGSAAVAPIGFIIDAEQHVWSFGDGVGGEDHKVLKDSLDQSVVGRLIVMGAGAAWINDSQNNWWTQDSTGKLVTALVGPFGVVPADLRSFNTHDGATVAASKAGPLPSAYVVDMNVATFSFGPLASNEKDFIILRNGIPFSEPGFTAKPYEGVMLRLKNGIAYIQNSAGSWVYPA